MSNLHPGPEEPLRIGWHENVSCYHHGWHNKRSRVFLFRATMPKPLQDYQMVVPCHHHKADKSHHTSHGSGSSRQRRSHWIFFCTPTHCRTSPTTMKSSRNWIIIQPHVPIISLPILTTPNLLKWSPLAICNPIRKSYPDAILWSTGTTCCPITSQFPDSSSPGFPCSPIQIDPQSNKEDNDMEIKAALPEEFSGETGDANRWLIAMEAYFTLHEDKYSSSARTVVFLNRMCKGQGKAFAEAWLTKLEDKHIANADKTWTKIKKAFKATFTPYDTAAQARVVLASLNQDWKNPSGFDKYISSLSLLSVHSRIINYHTLSEWFLWGLNPQITVQLTLLRAAKASTTIEELYSKASKIEGGYCHITSLRRGPQPSYGGSSHHHDLTLSPVERTCHMCKNHCFICHKEGCSTRNHFGYNQNRPTGSWHNNLKPSQTAHA